ncbi:unnamed protein product [Mortierella alpina]
MLRSGELSSKATKWRRPLMQQELSFDSGTAMYKRKLNLQCRSDGLELNNSEFKGTGRSQEQVDLQYRKNMGLPLEDQELLALILSYRVGLMAVLFCLKHEDVVLIADIATKHLLRLPDCTSWRQFLSGKTLSVLLAYVSTNCHACIRKAIPTVENCTSLTAPQLDLLDKVILGQEVVTSTELYKTQDPAGYICLTAMMWDIVEYKAKLWGTCLDPTNACPWSEMMQWLEMIPKIASIYGVKNPPAQVLKDGPA